MNKERAVRRASAPDTAHCSACDEDCEATFVCHICRHERNVCSFQIGGFTPHAQNVCVTCYENQQIDGVLLREMRKREEHRDRRR